MNNRQRELKHQNKFADLTLPHQAQPLEAERRLAVVISLHELGHVFQDARSM